MHISPQHRKPMNYYATKSLSTLCVRMTSAASSLSMQELNLKSDELATKLQKLLMLSSHRRLLLSKLQLFSVRLKGTRDYVFLVKAYNDNGDLLEKDETWLMRERLIDLVQEGKRIKREGRSKGANKSMDDEYSNDDDYNSDLGGDD
ncbi:unnamed protein product [Brassica oleracea]